MAKSVATSMRPLLDIQYGMCYVHTSFITYLITKRSNGTLEQHSGMQLSTYIPLEKLQVETGTECTIL